MDRCASWRSEVVTLTVEAALTITGQPENVTGEVGETAAFTVVAEGEDLSYQWQVLKPSAETWANVSSKTAGYNQATMTFTIAQKYNGYKYRCVVTDGSGNSVTSEVVTLTVEAALTIT